MNLTNIAAQRPTRLPAWYRMSSAASHSTVWMVAQAFASDEDGQPVMRADPEIVSAAVLAVLGAFEDLVQALGDYHGKDPQPALLTIRDAPWRSWTVSEGGGGKQRTMHACCTARAAPDLALAVLLGEEHGGRLRSQGTDRVTQ
ncbi:hypothetical protein ACFUKV_14500 [Streptomyces paradoxus]|uniref:hypothetical protein n=1 Tax=Streptomyces paradoxus TaxID=66375 RepID=UPI00362A371F